MTKGKGAVKEELLKRCMLGVWGGGEGKDVNMMVEESGSVKGKIEVKRTSRWKGGKEQELMMEGRRMVKGKSRKREHQEHEGKRGKWQ